MASCLAPTSFVCVHVERRVHVCISIRTELFVLGFVGLLYAFLHFELSL